MLDELKVYQPLVTDIDRFREYCKELAVVRFPSALRLEIVSQIRGHILGGNTIPELDVAFSRVLRITTAVSSSHTEQTAMVSTSRG